MSITEILEIIREIKNSPVNDEEAKMEAIVHLLCTTGYVNKSLSPETKLCTAEIFSLCC